MEILQKHHRKPISLQTVLPYSVPLELEP